MATTLPTFTISDAQATRLIAAFGSVANYKAWLKQQIIDYVVLYEDKAFDAQYVADRASRQSANRTSLSDIT